MVGNQRTSCITYVSLLLHVEESIEGRMAGPGNASNSHTLAFMPLLPSHLMQRARTLRAMSSHTPHPTQTGATQRPSGAVNAAPVTALQPHHRQRDPTPPRLQPRSRPVHSLMSREHRIPSTHIWSAEAAMPKTLKKTAYLPLTR